MRQVLIIDETTLFREYVKDKLVNEKVSVETAVSLNEGFKKLLTQLPNLLILDATFKFEDLLEFLKRKSENLNSKNIPVILSGGEIDPATIQQLLSYKIVKYFTKPIKFDVFFKTVGQLLGVPIPIDSTPCVLETHINSNIIFIEIAQGLNREKIALLRYKIGELITFNNLSNPKIVLMITNLQFSFVDTVNIEALLDSLLADMRVRRKSVKVLTLDKFLVQLVEGHSEYEGVQVSSDIGDFLSDIAPKGQEVKADADAAEAAKELLLTADDKTDEGSVQMRFHSDAQDSSGNDSSIDMQIKVAIVDDDTMTQQILRKAFMAINAQTDFYPNGADFLTAIDKKRYDIVILDILMPGLSGFEVLQSLQREEFSPIVIVYSSMSKRESVVQALSLGAKSYLIKPLKPEIVVHKAQELLTAATYAQEPQNE